jgi:hypothetical protein
VPSILQQTYTKIKAGGWEVEDLEVGGSLIFAQSLGSVCFDLDFHFANFFFFF